MGRYMSPEPTAEEIAAARGAPAAPPQTALQRAQAWRATAHAAYRRALALEVGCEEEVERRQRQLAAATEARVEVEAALRRAEANVARVEQEQA